MSTVHVEGFLAIGVSFKRWAQGDTPRVRFTKNKPALDADEIAIAIKLELPVGLFKKPTLNATLVVPPEKAPTELSIEMQSDIARIIREQTGIHVTISAPAQEPPQ